MAYSNAASDSIQSPLALLYRNGSPAVSSEVHIPVFRDVCLEKRSQELCEAMLEESEKLDRPIRSEAELNLYIDFHSKIDDLLRALKNLKHQEREPWVRILSQISEAIAVMENRLTMVSATLRKRITTWRELVLEGQRREAERLAAKAAEKEAEAKYSDNPQKQRAAKQEAKQLKREVQALKPTPTKGMDTEKYYDVIRITNRQQAALLPEAAIDMKPNQEWFNREAKIRIKSGERFNPRMFRGVELAERTRVRIHR
jgi:hypothetical protein